MVKRKFKRVVAINDLHCGSRCGLTPPEYQANPKEPGEEFWAFLQQEQWRWYIDKIAELGKPYVLLVVGDTTDGKGIRCDSRDTHKRSEMKQVSMAERCIEAWKAPNIYMVNGTRYHTGAMEEQIANDLDVSLRAHQFVEIECKSGNNVVFDIKHKVGRSTVPHGRYTAVAKEMLWNELLAIDGIQPASDFILRAHVHYFRYCGDGKRVAMTLPPLDGSYSEYGSEQCSDSVDFGLVSFDVYEDGTVDWKPHLAQLKSSKFVVEKVK